MTMKATSEVVNPESVVLSIKMEMTVEEWDCLIKRLGDDWPGWQFKAAINTALSEVKNRVTKRFDEDPYQKELA